MELKCEASDFCEHTATLKVKYIREDVRQPSPLKDGIVMCPRHGMGVLDQGRWTERAIKSVTPL